MVCLLSSACQSSARVGHLPRTRSRAFRQLSLMALGEAPPNHRISAPCTASRLKLHERRVRCDSATQLCVATPVEKRTLRQVAPLYFGGDAMRSTLNRAIPPCPVVWQRARRYRSQIIPAGIAVDVRVRVG